MEVGFILWGFKAKKICFIYLRKEVEHKREACSPAGLLCAITIGFLDRAACPVSTLFPNSDPQHPRQWGEKAIYRYGCIVEFFLGLKIQDHCLSR